MQRRITSAVDVEREVVQHHPVVGDLTGLVVDRACHDEGIGSLRGALPIGGEREVRQPKPQLPSGLRRRVVSPLFVVVAQQQPAQLGGL